MGCSRRLPRTASARRTRESPRPGRIDGDVPRPCDPEESRTPGLTLGVSSLEVPRTYSVPAAHGAGATPHPLPGGALLSSRSGTGASSGSTWLISSTAAAGLSSFGSRAEIERGEGSAVVARLSLIMKSRPASSSRRLVSSAVAVACLLWGFFDRRVFLDSTNEHLRRLRLRGRRAVQVLP